MPSGNLRHVLLVDAFELVGLVEYLCGAEKAILS